MEKSSATDFKQQPKTKRGNVNGPNPHETQAESLISLCNKNGVTVFLDNFNEPYASVPSDNHIEPIKLKTKKFRLFLTKTFYHVKGKLLSPDAAQQVITHFEAMATYGGITHTLFRRVGSFQDKYYYDLADDKWRAVEISKAGFKVVTKQPLLFHRMNNMDQQVIPSEGGLLSLFKDHFRFKTKYDRILLIVYLVSCFIPDIPHPLLVFAGEKGAAKSTTMRMVRKIVDPARSELMSLPNSEADLILALANNYMPSFDNLERISSDKSDILCMASTGGATSKRTLYTDADDTIISFKRCVTLNGINVVVSRPDLLDRSIILQLKRVPTDQRKTEQEVWDDFNKDLPHLLGWCFTTLSKAMSIYPNVQLTELPRMADFAKWGYAIAEAAGFKGSQFIKAYSHNQQRLNEEVISNNPVASVLLIFMENQNLWEGDWTTLLFTLEGVAKQQGIYMNQRGWPKAAHSLSRKMNEIKSNLEQVGISFDTRRNSTKELTVRNHNLSV